MIDVKWTFSPYDPGAWNNSDERVMIVGPEPNALDAGDEKLHQFDMGCWFRTANQSNKYWNSRSFYPITIAMVNGALRSEDARSLRQFRFFDLKATAGEGKANETKVKKYVREHKDEIIGELSGRCLHAHPTIVVLIGATARDVFTAYLWKELAGMSGKIRWAAMPHPTSMTDGDLFRNACKEIPIHLVDIAEPCYAWFYTNRNKYGWVKIK